MGDPMTQTDCSVVVPVEGELGPAEETLRSLFGQLAPARELLVVSAGLPQDQWDRLLALQQEHPAVMVVRQRSPGLVRALNAGLSVAGARYVAWLLPGCRLAPEALGVLSQALEERPEAGFAFGRCPHQARAGQAPQTGDVWRERLLDHNPVGCCFLVRRERADLAGPLREDIPGLEAWDWWIRLSEQSGVAELPEVLCQCAEGRAVQGRRQSESAAAAALIAAHRRRRAATAADSSAGEEAIGSIARPSPSHQERGPKVLLLAPDLAPAWGYAVGRHLQGLARALAEKGCEVHVLAPGGCPSARRRVEGLWAHSAQQRPPFRAPNVVADVLQEQALLLSTALEANDAFGPFDLIHAHGWTGASLAHSLRQALALPLVFTLHRAEGLESEGHSQADALYVREVISWICEQAERVICLSAAGADYARRTYRVPRGKLTVTTVGVDTRDWQTDAELAAFRELFGPPGSRLITFAGRLVQHTGPQLLVEALPHVLAVMPEARAVIAGEGPMQERLRHRAQELNVHHAITFTGELRGKVLATLLWASDVFVMPSLVELSGQGAVEAMACGVPVVASAAEAAVELIEHEENGVLVTPDDGRALAAGIVRVLYDRELAGRVAAEGQARVLAQHLWRDVVGRCSTSTPK